MTTGILYNLVDHITTVNNLLTSLTTARTYAQDNSFRTCHENARARAAAPSFHD